ncbi:MAG TPA: glycosyltransferase family 2 protein [Trichormus sp.]|jgi:hypothetical protein
MVHEPVLDVCISVVSGNNPQMTIDCLHSLVSSLSGDLKVEIHFVDNASPVDWFESVQKISPLISVHRNERRKGFGANHNAIMAKVSARYYLLLNDDTYIHANCCEELVRTADRNGTVGFFGAKLFNGDGTIQRSAYRFPSVSLALSEALLLNRLFGFLEIFDDYRSFGHDRLRTVDFVSGAAILARKEMLDEIGLLDEQFFMYAEETDWCMRGKKTGWLTMFVPSAQLVHYGGQSTVKFAPERSVEFLRSHARLLTKHSGRGGVFAYKILNLIKHLPRVIIAHCAQWPASKRLAETDIVLWSLGLLNRSGLSEIASTNVPAPSSTRPS